MRPPALTLGHVKMKTRGVPFVKIRAFVMETARSLLAAHRHAQTRTMLRQLDPYLLRDIGIDPAVICKPPRDAQQMTARLKVKTLF